MFTEMRPLRLYNHVVALPPFKTLANNRFFALLPLAFHFHGHGGRWRWGMDADERHPLAGTWAHGLN